MRPISSTSGRIDSKVRPATRRLLNDTIAMQSAYSGKPATIDIVLHAALTHHARALRTELSERGIDPQEAIQSRSRAEVVDPAPDVDADPNGFLDLDDLHGHGFCD